MMNTKEHIYVFRNYRVAEEPFLLPSEIRDNRNKEVETRNKNRANRKRLKRSKR